MNKVSQFSRRCLFLLLLAFMVVSASIAQGFEQRMFFASNRDGDWDIYSMNADGDDVVQLTDHPASDEDPACSPDGRRIVFRSERGVTPDLYMMDSDGGNVIRLTQDNFGEGTPSWTPDGTKFAFASFRFVVGNVEIYAMDADGNNVINLTNHNWHDVSPSWSPDGSKMAFSSYRTGAFNDPHHIFIMNADGSERRNLTGDTQLRDNGSPTWSPVGRKIAFHSYRHFVPARSRYDIFMITADGNELKQLTDGPRTNHSPVYSPDGTKIAYVSGRRGNSNIFLMDTDGRNTVNLTKTPPGVDNRFPSWPRGALAVNRAGKLPISWAELKRARNPQ